MGEAFVRRLIASWVNASLTPEHMAAMLVVLQATLHRLASQYGANELLTQIEDKIDMTALAQELSKDLLALLAPIMASTTPIHAGVEFVRIVDLTAAADKINADLHEKLVAAASPAPGPDSLGQA